MAKSGSAGKKFENMWSDKNLVAKANDLLGAVQNAANLHPSEVVQKIGDAHIFTSAKGFWFLNEVHKIDELAEALSRFLGAKIGRKSDIKNRITESIGKWLNDGVDTKEATREFLNRIYVNSDRRWQFIAPNYLLRLDAAVDRFSVGPVTVVRVEDINRVFPNLSLEDQKSLESDSSLYAEWPSEKSTSAPFHMWVVECNGPRETRSEEAKWLIDIVISFIRLSIRRALFGWPNHGDIEPQPLSPPTYKQLVVAVVEEKLDITRSHWMPGYLIDAGAVDEMQRACVRSQAALLFDPPAGSVAERVARGLGWLARGRQAADRAERLLYFFTAIEALLASEDKSSPVVHTIARHASVILTNDIDGRYLIFDKIKDLYRVRSNLVHRGDRFIHWDAAIAAQMCAEDLFRCVLGAQDLSQKFDIFEKELAKASHGRSWPPECSPTSAEVDT